MMNTRQTVWTPWHELNNVLSNPFNRIFSGLLPEFMPDNEYPPVNVWKNENEIMLSIKLPGIKMEDIEVNINRDTLTIKCARNSEDIPEGTVTVRQERINGSFARSFALPFAIEQNDVEAKYKDGILTIKLPKAKTEQPRRIAINANEQ